MVWRWVNIAKVVAFLTAVTLGCTLAAPTAAARAPLPPASLATPSVDAHLGYVPQRSCSPTAKPGTRALLAALIKAYGGGSLGISRGCGVGGTSEHKEGRALDWARNVKYRSHRSSVDRAIRWLTANNGEVALRLGVMYVLWNQRIWSVYYPELGWRKMASRGSYTANHKDHVHISLSWDGAMKQTSWWTGIPVTEPLHGKCGVAGAPRCLPTLARTNRPWPYQQTAVPDSFLPAASTTPGIGGSPQVGRTLTAVAGTWIPAGSPISYQWTANGRDLPGATGATYLVPAEVAGQELRVRVDAGALPGRKTSAATIKVVPARRFSEPRLQLTGSAVVDQAVAVRVGAWATEADTLSYQWLHDDAPIPGAEGSAYAVRPQDVGTWLSVAVTAAGPGWQTTTRTAAATLVGAASFSAAPRPTLTGAPQVGATLTAVSGTWSPAPEQLSWRWFADDEPIDGAVAPQLPLTDSLAGRSVRVEVTATRAGYLDRTVGSEPVLVG